MSAAVCLELMKLETTISPMMIIKRKRMLFCRLFSMAIFLSVAFFVGSEISVTNNEKSIRWDSFSTVLNERPNSCKTQCRPSGSEALPKGIASITSDLEMRPLWGHHNKKKAKKSSTSLLAIAVGIKQKEAANKIVQKFMSSDFVIMLFHYDAIVDAWRDLEWCDYAIHISAINQTKWWFAKRFLHPDIVSEYAYIFLWDEDLGVDHFNVQRYLSIVQEEGLEISQPALDPQKSEVHHDLTARNSKRTVHRRIHGVTSGRRECSENSTAPPCTGWVEMMAPVFSKESWRCVWHMIQNDLVHAWGLDFQLGYCAQGDRTKNIGVVDSEYIVHYGVPTLGGSKENMTTAKTPHGAVQKTTLLNREELLNLPTNKIDGRSGVRRQSFIDLDIFKNRWRKAVNEDKCWKDPFQ